MKAPLWVTSRIRKVGGVNSAGLPLFRIVWGGDRFTHIGGRWHDYDDNETLIRSVVEVRKVLKYPKAEKRWVFEAWMPPENYGTFEVWKERTHKIFDGVTLETMGEYPAEGEYELMMVLETPKAGAYVPLTHAIVDALVQTASRNRNLSTEVRMRAFHDAQEREKKAKSERMFDRLCDMRRPEFARGDSYVVVPDMTEIARYS